jgi:predicted nucleotidyltransferase component of viral defense system
MAGEAPPRPLRLRLATAARAAGKPQFVIEKDYALSYLLAGIGRVPTLREALVLKGGTCLRKAYFAGYRFSEDLDYTARAPWSCDALLDALQDARTHMQSLLLAQGAFEVIVAHERHRAPHPRGQCSLRVRVQFPWMRAPDCSLKIEVSAQEPLLSQPAERSLIHEFPGESPAATIVAYRLEEIATEKLRAFLQSRQHLQDRGWLHSRPRDLYDLWYLHKSRGPTVSWRDVGELLPAKAAAYGLGYAGPDDFLDRQVLQGIQRDWRAHLASFVIDLPPFEVCLASYHMVLEAVLH